MKETKKFYTIPQLELVSLCQDAILNSEVGTGWNDAWNDLGDDAFSAGV